MYSTPYSKCLVPPNIFPKDDIRGFNNRVLLLIPTFSKRGVGYSVQCLVGTHSLTFPSGLTTSGSILIRELI